MFSLICVWIYDWVNNREAGDLRHYRTHYDVIVMLCIKINYFFHIHIRNEDEAGFTKNFSIVKPTLKTIRPVWILSHDDVIKWKHFPHHWPFVRGIHRGLVNSPHKNQWRVALMFSLICAWIDGWVNNREAGDLRRYRAHHDVTVMSSRHFMRMQWQQSYHDICKNVYDHFVWIWLTAKRIFHRIWIAMEKSFVKWSKKSFFD